MALLDYQLSIGSLVLGPGTPYLVHSVDGFGTPEVRTSDVARPQRDGDFVGLDTYGSRVLTIDVSVTGSDSADALANYDALVAAWRLSGGATTAPLTHKLPGRVESILLGRPRRLSADSFDRLKTRRIGVKLEYYSPDAAVYSSAQTVAQADIATIVGGRTYAKTFPVAYGGGTSGVVTLVNAGNFPVWPVVRFYGGPSGSSNPSIENITAGKTLTYAAAIAAGDYVEIDMDARTVLLNGTATRRANLAVGSKWWALDPGASSVRYAGSGAGSYATVTYRSAWLG